MKLGDLRFSQRSRLLGEVKLQARKSETFLTVEWPGKLLLVLASIVILDRESRGTHYHVSLPLDS
jgi:hypothetical protein